MAIQNFISGGFFGKLGQIVGQRWHNKRIMRTYVVPNNPRTPAQVAVRKEFATAVKLAQQAMNINKGDPAWKRDDMGEYSWRVGTAKRRLQAGMSEAQALPLYPDGYKKVTLIEEVYYEFEEEQPVFAFTNSTAFGPDSRKFLITLHHYDPANGGWVDRQYEVTANPGPSWEIVFPVAKTQMLPTGSWIEGATIDDGDFGMNAYEIPRTEVDEVDRPRRIIGINFVNVTWKTEELELEFAMDYDWPVPLPDIFLGLYWQHLGSMEKDGEWFEWLSAYGSTFSPSTAWDTGNQYPSGSYVTVDDLNLDMGLYVIGIPSGTWYITQPYSP